MIFGKKTQNESKNDKFIDFNYLRDNTYYFDSACQTLRPQQVIDAETDYYHNFNACGHRVKYKWGEIVDKKVEETRENLLKFAKKSKKDYTVFFTLNTTFGINFVLQQLNPENYDKIITSDIEHNSVFLTSITWANRNNKERLVLEREVDGGLIYEKNDLTRAIVSVNSTSNIDGRNLENIKELCNDVHKKNGILLLDACQTFAHNPEILHSVDFDAAFGAGHKMYGPSIGFAIIKKDLIKNMNPYLIGGSTVSDVREHDYDLIEDDTEIFARLEPGLQNFAGIIGLNESINWRNSFKKDGMKAGEYEENLKIYLNERLNEIENLNLLYEKPSSVVSMNSKKFDGHQLSIFLSQRNIMARSGYHCCHYYLKNKLGLEPQFRISLGLNNTKKQIDYLVDSLQIILK